MKEKKRLPPKLVIFAVLTGVTAFAWIGFEIYRASTKRPEPVVPPAVLQTLDPNLDSITLEGLVNKVYLDDSEIGDTVIQSLIPAIVEPIPEEVVNTEIIPEELQNEQLTATESGQT